MSGQTEWNERLSALCDGELADAEVEHLLCELDSSDELRARWQRLCMVRAASEGVHLAPKRDICAGVMAAIADAPIPARDTRVVALPQRPAIKPARREWLPAAGLAAAASLVAVVAVTAIRNQAAVNVTGSAEPVALAPVAETQPAAATIEAAQLDDAAARQLDNLVIEHANYRG